jgi:hypothetical protein
MKNVIYFLSLILIACCYCSAKNDYENIIHQFVELNESMGAAKEDVGVMLANVKATLDKSKKAAANFFRTIETHCASGVARLNAAIKANTDAVTDATSNVNTWGKNLAAAVKDRKDAKSEIAKGRAQLKGLRKRIAKLAMDYRVFAEEADKKLTVVKVLRDIITDELFNRAPGALVQVNKFQQKLSELKEMLNNNSDSLYSPIISVLLDLATEQNFADQGILRKILDNLKNLHKALVDFRTKQEKSLDAEMVTLKKQIKNVKHRIRAYRRMSHQAASKAIDARHYIAFYKHEIAHFTAEAGRMGKAKSFFVKLCDFEKKVHKAAKAHNKRLRSVVLPKLFGSVQTLAKK